MHARDGSEIYFPQNTRSNRSHSFPDAQQYPAMPLPQPRCVKLAVENVERSRQIAHLSISFWQPTRHLENLPERLLSAARVFWVQFPKRAPLPPKSSPCRLPSLQVQVQQARRQPRAGARPKAGACSRPARGQCIGQRRRILFNAAHYICFILAAAQQCAPVGSRGLAAVRH